MQPYNAKINADPADCVGRETLAALYPYDVRTGMRTGGHPGKTFTPNETVPFGNHLFFQAEDVSFGGPREMHQMLVRLAEEGRAFVVRGQRAHQGGYLRRTKTRKGRCPPGLRVAQLHCLPVDCDKWPNLMSLDPRSDPQAGWWWMLEILGPEFSDVTVSAHWSSSCCSRTPIGEAPATLDARFWFWLDGPLGEQGVRSLLKRLDARVRARLAEMGASIAKGHRLVDPKVADCQQPIYLAPPRFLDGMIDPLPGKRHALIKGDRDAVSLMACLTGLPETETAGPSDEPGSPSKIKAIKAPRVRKTLMSPKVISLAASARLIAAEREMLDAAIKGTGSSEYRSACVNLYYRRAALEMAALAIHRGGLPVGTRDEHCTMIASAYVASLPVGLAAERVRRELRGLLAPVVGDEWLLDEWEAKADASIVSRYLGASRGERSANGQGLRYTYSKARLIEEWEPTYTEIRELGLRSLASDADRLAAEREAAGCKAKDEWLAHARSLAPRVHQMKAEGRSARGISRETGLPIAKVLRLLALGAETVAELADRERAPQDIKVTELADRKTNLQEVPITDPLPKTIAYLMASQGFLLPEEVADALGEPLELVSITMAKMGLRTELRLAA